MLNFVQGREACPASAGWNVGKTLAQTAVFWTVFLAVLPAAAWYAEQAVGLDGYRFGGVPWQVAGVVLFVLGGSLGITSGMVMAVRGCGTPLPADCPRQLVLAGPYRYVRNPMAVAGIAQGVAVGLFLGSPLVIAYALAGGPVWHFFVRPWEEADLEQRFGESYRLYRSAVWCWWPRWSGYRVPAQPQQQSSLVAGQPESTPTA